LRDDKERRELGHCGYYCFAAETVRAAVQLLTSEKITPLDALRLSYDKYISSLESTASCQSELPRTSEGPNQSMSMLWKEESALTMRSVTSELVVTAPDGASVQHRTSCIAPERSIPRMPGGY